MTYGVEKIEAQEFKGSHPAYNEFKNQYSNILNQHLMALKELIVRVSDLNDVIWCLLNDFETLHLDMNKAVNYYGKP